MYLGEYSAGDKLWAFINTSNFQTGQIETGIITAFRLRVGDAFATKVSVTFGQGAFENGVKYADIDTTGFSSGMWIIQAHVTVNLIEVTTTFCFRIT